MRCDYCGEPHDESECPRQLAQIEAEKHKVVQRSLVSARNPASLDAEQSIAEAKARSAGGPWRCAECGQGFPCECRVLAIGDHAAESEYDFESPPLKYGTVRMCDRQHLTSEQARTLLALAERASHFFRTKPGYEPSPGNLYDAVVATDALAALRRIAEEGV